MITENEKYFLYALNEVVGADLFKIVNKDKNFLYFAPKLLFKGTKYIQCLCLDDIKKCKSHGDFFMLACRELNNY